MVFESITTALKAERTPWKMFFLGALYASIALFLSIWIFKEHASLIMVFLTVFASVPLVYNTIKLEEQKDIKIKSEGLLLVEHGKALSVFIFLFFGFIVAFSFWYLVLPTSFVGDLFGVQIQTINAINSRLVGGTIESLSLLSQIFTNNIKVLIFCILFSFFYGMGAIFILTWNASVIAAAIGTFFRSNISVYAQQIGLLKVAGYFHIFSLSLMRYMTHGVFEILAYFIGGLAGGIISIAIIRHDLDNEKFRRIMFDALNLLFISVIILVVAALVEVFITPALF